MKITKAEFWTEHIPLTRPYTISYKTIDAVENIFVRLETADGNWGIGVASPSESVTGESFDKTRHALSKHLAPLVLHQNLLQFEHLQRNIHQQLANTPAACAAVDIALYDLFCKHIQLPIATYLGQVHQALPTSITIGIKSIEESVEEAQEYLERHFKIIKLKIGKSLEEDVECIRKIYETVGGKMKIRVDANQGYSTQDLNTFLKKTEKIGVELIEQPFPASENALLQEITAEARQQLAADESLLSAKDGFKLATMPETFGIFNIKLMKCGGIHSSQKIADYAQKSGIELMWGCNDESCVSIAAALHSAFASKNTRYIDLDGSLDLSKDPFKGGFIIENGMMRLTDRWGLGVELI